MTQLKELKLTTPEAASFFLEASKVNHLQPFLLGEQSLADAAKLLGLSKTRMSYWLSKMLELNLIEQVQVEKRGKHNVPIYRARAETFRIPLEAIPVESDEALMDINTKAFEQQVKYSLIRSGRKYAEGWHLCCALREGKMWRDIVPGSGNLEDAKIANYFGKLRLYPKNELFCFPD
jgi:DNA-binding transcriptional ArsR family regulator